MPRVTIKTDYVPSNPWGETDANNIGINLNYILDEDTIFIGDKEFEKLGVRANNTDGYELFKVYESAQTSPAFTLYSDFSGSGSVGNYIRFGSSASGWEPNILRMRGDGLVYMANSLSIGESEINVAGKGKIAFFAGSADDNPIISIHEDNTGVSFSLKSYFSGTGSTGNSLGISSFWDSDMLRLYGDGTLDIAANSDILFTYGRARLGTPSGLGNNAVFGHISYFNSTSYAIRQNSAGDTILNAHTGRGIGIKIGNASDTITINSSETKINNNILPTTTPTETTITRTTAGTTLLPRGVFKIEITTEKISGAEATVISGNIEHKTSDESWERVGYVDKSGNNGLLGALVSNIGSTTEISPNTYFSSGDNMRVNVTIDSGVTGTVDVILVKF